MSTKKTDFDWLTAYCNSTTSIFIPISPWMDSGDIEKIRVGFELSSRINNLVAQAAYQTAVDTRNPNTAVGFGGGQSSEGIHDPGSFEEVGGSFGGKLYFRLGFNVSNSAGTALSLARLRGSVLLIGR